MEYDNKLANINAKANAGLTTGIIGTSGVAASLLANLLGINGTAGCRCGGNPTCSEDMPVNRYELALEQANAAKDAEIALLKANSYNDQKDLELYKFFAGEIKSIREVQAAQAVHNQKTEDSFLLARQDIAAVESRLNGKIAMEAERRCCADNAIVTYANATFYPKMVADVTVGTTTTAQTLYNPIPSCGERCCG